MGQFHAVLVLLAGFALMGCAAPPPQVAVQALQEAQIQPARWSGRLALLVDDGNDSIDSAIRSHSFSAAFALQGSPEQGELILYTPLGTVLARLLWQRASAQLEHDGQVHHAPEVEALLAKLGVQIVPVAVLFDWLQGRPTPVAGWQVDLGAMAQGRITAQRLQPLPQATLRMVLH